ncbi:YfiT family bacillithiol transferase [Wenyingzhuangia marina]|uniref:DinB superfamily protein n=1 Tax=Wenyingzhuangia marina TaxID=1195760 RepID=A0A1M5SLY3_9FLAO|nr:putative metal-dependent hydrolase [Wenyingzhuangia marina]GGF62766.1 putative metal-dependent hydrolase YfiT [Wenyingzhuangia marina]SHH39268.1 DinB superfamily protein [Wenyingzhuangia marina]
MDLQKLKFPIGVYESNKKPSTDLLDKWITDIEELPSKLELITKDIEPEKLNWKYRPNGWNVKQVIHHCADSHMNCIIRFKLALTEETPTIRPYYENRWAELIDSQDNNIEDSMKILIGLHKKWGILLRSLTKEQLTLEFIHPEHRQTFNLAETIGNYAWHCNHHFAHVKNGIESGGKYN